MESDNNLLELLKKYFNYTKFKSDIQENAIKAIVAGKKSAKKSKQKKLQELIH